MSSFSSPSPLLSQAGIFQQCEWKENLLKKIVDPRTREDCLKGYTSFVRIWAFGICYPSLLYSLETQLKYYSTSWFWLMFTCKYVGTNMQVFFEKMETSWYFWSRAHLDNFHDSFSCLQYKFGDQLKSLLEVAGAKVVSS